MFNRKKLEVVDKKLDEIGIMIAKLGIDLDEVNGSIHTHLGGVEQAIRNPPTQFTPRARAATSIDPDAPHDPPNEDDRAPEDQP